MCVAASATKASEVVLWVDEEGRVGYEPLWAWAPPECGAKAAPCSRLLTSTEAATVHVEWTPPPVEGWLGGGGGDGGGGGGACLRITPTKERSSSEAAVTYGDGIAMPLPELAAEALVHQQEVLLAPGSHDSCSACARVILGAEHVAVLGEGFSQVCNRSDGGRARWHTLLGDCDDACFVGASTLLLLSVRAASLRVLELESMATIASASLPSNTEGAADDSSWARARVIPEASQQPRSGVFALLLGSMYAWLGQLTGTIPLNLSLDSRVRVVCGPHVDWTRARSFSRLNASDGEALVELRS